MADRGRKSAASLEVVTALPGQRPGPPEELTSDQAGVWRAAAATKPADRFAADTHPLLAGVTHSNIAEAEPHRALSMYDVRMHVLSAGGAFDLDRRRPAEMSERRDSQVLEAQAAGNRRRH